MPRAKNLSKAEIARAIGCSTGNLSQGRYKTMPEFRTLNEFKQWDEATRIRGVGRVGEKRAMAEYRKACMDSIKEARKPRALWGKHPEIRNWLERKARAENPKPRKKKFLRFKDLRGRNGRLRGVDGRLVQCHSNVGSWSILWLAMRKQGMGGKVIARELGVSAHNVFHFFRSLDLDSLPHATGGGFITPEVKDRRLEERAWRAYEDARMRDIKRCAKDRTWGSHPAYITHCMIKKYRTDPVFKFKCTARRRFRKVIKAAQTGKKVSAIRGLGCSVEYAMAYIEAQFTKSMTWENHGTRWELDHVRPLASFDLTKESEQREAVHYTNLQPLTIKANRRKSAKWDGQQEFVHEIL